MDTNVKNSLMIAGSAIAGGYGGSWLAQRVCTAMGCALGPWGSAIGAVLGAMATTALAKSMLTDGQALPDLAQETMEAVAREHQDP